MATEPIIVDARGLRCPLPVLKMEKQLAAMGGGVDLIVLATDPMAKVDIALHCRQNGYACDLDETEGTLRFTISKVASR